MEDQNSAIASFVATMPAEYQERYASDTIAAHERLSSRRGSAKVDVGIFERNGDVTGLCIVADDRPGLFSLITEAFAVCGLDVVAGDAFTRSVNGNHEAVDMFWLRQRRGGPFTNADLDRLRETLLSLQEGYATPTPPNVNASATGYSNSTVRFIEDKNGSLSTLEVETEDRTGLLLGLSRALHAQHVQIVRSEVKTMNGRVFDRFVIAEIDGSPVSAQRRLEIQVSILSAAEPAKRLTSSPPPALPSDAVGETETV